MGCAHHRTPKPSTLPTRCLLPSLGDGENTTMQPGKPRTPRCNQGNPCRNVLAAAKGTKALVGGCFPLPGPSSLSPLKQAFIESALTSSLITNDIHIGFSLDKSLGLLLY